VLKSVSYFSAFMKDARNLLDAIELQAEYALETDKGPDSISGQDSLTTQGQPLHDKCPLFNPHGIDR